MSNRVDQVRSYIRESSRVVATLERHAELIEKIGKTITAALQQGHKILSAGNGGSAAEAMHLTEELTGKYSQMRRALPGLCFNADVTALTCIANDWDYASVFSRQAEAFAQKGDVFVGFTTSGNSENILRTMQVVKAAGGINIGLLGRGGGKAATLADLALIVDSPLTNHIQEAHQAVLHMILEHVDSVFVPPKA